MQGKIPRADRGKGHIRVLTTYPSQDASRRLRIDPLVEQFRTNGFAVDVDEIFSPLAYQWKNRSSARRLYAALSVGVGLIRRLAILRFGGRCDIMIIHREAFPFLTPKLEQIAGRKSRIAVLDVDDAIHHDVTHGHDWRRHLRNPADALEFPAIFDVILCGNPQLVETYGSSKARTLYAPTCPEMTVHRLPATRQNSYRNVVWIGSQSTLGSLSNQLPAIKRALRRTSSTLLVLGGDNVLDIEQDEHVRVALWTPQRELEALKRSTIGIMPLSDTDWERGKSGFKAIMYMCGGLKAVVSPVGFNKVLCDRYGAIPCDSDWEDVMERTLLDTAGVPADQLARIRADFNPKNIAAYSCEQIDNCLAERVGQ